MPYGLEDVWKSSKYAESKKITLPSAKYFKVETFEACVAVHLRIPVFRDTTLRQCVIVYRRFEAA
jgi:hypothetical protein